MLAYSKPLICVCIIYIHTYLYIDAIGSVWWGRSHGSNKPLPRIAPKKDREKDVLTSPISLPAAMPPIDQTQLEAKEMAREPGNYSLEDGGSAPSLIKQHRGSHGRI